MDFIKFQVPQIFLTVLPEGVVSIFIAVIVLFAFGFNLLELFLGFIEFIQRFF